MKKTIAITGASGLLGQYLTSYFAKDAHVLALYLHHPPDFKENKNIQPLQIDLTKSDSVETFFRKHSADFLIHTAGLTSVDKCEEDGKLAELLNVQITSLLVDELKKTKTKMIHISTDHLFSGHASMLSEESPTQPVNVYARTKDLAEKKVQELANSLIIRTNFYGGVTNQKKSFSNWIYQELSAGKTIHAFDNSYFTPISVPSLTENIEKIINSNLAGIYNIVGADRLSKFQFAHQLAEVFGLNVNLIQRSCIENAKLKAPRPHDMSLSIEKIKNDLPSFHVEKLYDGLQKIRQFGLI